MSKFCYVILLLCISIYDIASASFFPHSQKLFENNFNVRKLGDLDFQKTIEGTDHVWVVDFYHPSCPHCQKYAPTWEHIADFYAEASNVHIAVVNCQEHQKVCAEQAIRGYPTLKAFNVEKDPIEQEEYGKRTENDIIEWVESIMQGVNRVPLDNNSKSMLGKRVRTGAVEATIENTGQTQLRKVQPVGKVSQKARLQDAATAFMNILRTSIFTGTMVLEKERYEAARTWLTTVSVAFPHEANRRAIKDLVRRVQEQNSWEYGHWGIMVDEWLNGDLVANTQPANLFESGRQFAICTTETCALWSLFHIMTTNVIESAGETPYSDVASGIRTWVFYFFGCIDCRNHFLAANPQSVIDKIAASKNGHVDLMLWLWRMHNSVNNRIGKPIWPSRHECSACYSLNGTDKFDEDRVMEFLQSNFGIDAVMYNASSSSSSYTILYIFGGIVGGLVLLALVTAAVMHSKNVRSQLSPQFNILSPNLPRKIV